MSSRLSTASTKFIRRSFKLIQKRERKRVLQLALIQSVLGVLDLIGVASLGVVTALAVNGVQSRPPGDRVSTILKILGISEFPFRLQVSILAVLTLVSLVGRTLLSIWFSRKTLRFLSKVSARISADLITRLLSQPLLKVQARSTSETVYAVTAGVGSIVLGIISVTVSLLSDISLLVVLSIGLFYLNPLIAISTFAVFGIVGLLLYWLQHNRASRLGKEFTDISISRDGRIIEVLASYRELMVRDRRKYYSSEINGQTVKLSDLQAEMSFLPQINKYVVEITVVLGTFIISAIQFALQDLTQAVSTLAIFSASAARIAPSVIRIQQSALLMKSSLASARPTLDMIEEFSKFEADDYHIAKLDVEHVGFNNAIEVSELSFKYDGSPLNNIDKVSFRIESGEFVALVGPSGAGKTTLADLLLGVIDPDEGAVILSGVPPAEAIRIWPGSVAYVPQDILIVQGTVLDNVSLGYPQDEKTTTLCIEALEIAQLSNFLADCPNGLFTQMGERGTKISGGQRQRIGIARALFTKPKLLVLDEATSSLDGVTEDLISEQINRLKGHVTLIVIAHRLSTLRKADKVIYLDHGKIKSVGTFSEVRAAIADFDQQASLMGLGGE